MKIVIDIDEEEYNALYKIYHGYEYPHTLGLAGRIYYAVANGQVLPKGHGRLIDADYLRDTVLLHNYHNVPYSDRKGYRLRQREVDVCIINAPTIIEADKEKEV